MAAKKLATPKATTNPKDMQVPQFFDMHEEYRLAEEEKVEKVSIDCIKEAVQGQLNDEGIVEDAHPNRADLMKIVGIISALSDTEKRVAVQCIPDQILTQEIARRNRQRVAGLQAVYRESAKALELIKL